MRGIAEEFLCGLDGYYRAFPAVLKSKHGIDVMIFDVTHFNVHDPVQADAFLALAEAFFNEKTLAEQRAGRGRKNEERQQA